MANNIEYTTEQLAESARYLDGLPVGQLEFEERAWLRTLRRRGVATVVNGRVVIVRANG
jgi:hypothetical protein